MKNFLPLLTLALLGLSAPGQEPSKAAQPAPVHPPDPQKEVEKKFAAAQSRLIKKSATDYELGEIKINAATREIRVPCTVLHRQLPLEYLLVHETGKDHETILTTAVSPLDLQVAMLLANYSPGSSGLFTLLPKDEPVPFPETAPAVADAHRVTITVEWKNTKDQAQSAPLALWYQNSDTRQPPAIDFWVFNGSRIDEHGFVAESEGSFISVYADPNALFNSPAAGNHRDDLWISLPENVPPERTPVSLIIAPYQPKAAPSKAAPGS